ITIFCPRTGIKQTFSNKTWVHDEHKYRLYECVKKRETEPPALPWFVWIFTSNVKDAGTDSSIKITLYGENGKSNIITLSSSGGFFERGQCEKFKVDIVDVGTPYKLRINHEQKDENAAWCLSRIEMENITTKKRYIFKCDAWLSKRKNDRQLITELPAEGEDISWDLPGTNSEVFINIYGGFGDTGKRWLEQSLTHKVKFLRGQMDTFVIEAVELKTIRKILIGRDDSDRNGWYLDTVILRQKHNDDFKVTFLCNSWLRSDENDGIIWSEFFVARKEQLQKFTYHIRMKYGGDDINSVVYLQILGENREIDIKDMKINKRDNISIQMHDQLAEFTYEFMNLGDILSVAIVYNGSVLLIDYVEIEVPKQLKLYKFLCDCCLGLNVDNRQTQIGVAPTSVENLILYEIIVYTGDASAAGTVANVFIDIFASNRNTPRIKLRNHSDNFARDRTDFFYLPMVYLGRIKKILIGHDSKKFGDAWLLEK
ncbi:unnamed protein product, partial [Didymodactylos carnosus]